MINLDRNNQINTDSENQSLQNVAIKANLASHQVKLANDKKDKKILKTKGLDVKEIFTRAIAVMSRIIFGIPVGIGILSARLFTFIKDKFYPNEIKKSVEKMKSTEESEKYQAIQNTANEYINKNRKTLGITSYDKISNSKPTTKEIRQIAENEVKGLTSKLQEKLLNEDKSSIIGQKRFRHLIRELKRQDGFDPKWGEKLNELSKNEFLILSIARYAGNPFIIEQLLDSQIDIKEFPGLKDIIIKTLKSSERIEGDQWKKTENKVNNIKPEDIEEFKRSLTNMLVLLKGEEIDAPSQNRNFMQAFRKVLESPVYQVTKEDPHDPTIKLLHKLACAIWNKVPAMDAYQELGQDIILMTGQKILNVLLNKKDLNDDQKKILKSLAETNPDIIKDLANENYSAFLKQIPTEQAGLKDSLEQTFKSVEGKKFSEFILNKLDDQHKKAWEELAQDSEITKYLASGDYESILKKIESDYALGLKKETLEPIFKLLTQLKGDSQNFGNKISHLLEETHKEMKNVYFTNETILHNFIYAVYNTNQALGALDSEGGIARDFALGGNYDPHGQYSNNPSLQGTTTIQRDKGEIKVQNCYGGSPTIGDHKLSPEFLAVLQAAENNQFLEPKERDPDIPTQVIYNNLQNLDKTHGENDRSRTIMLANHKYPLSFRGMTLSKDSLFYNGKVKDKKMSKEEKTQIEESMKWTNSEEFGKMMKFQLMLSFDSKETGHGFFFPGSKEEWGRIFDSVITQATGHFKDSSLHSPEEMRGAYIEYVYAMLIAVNELIVGKELQERGIEALILEITACKENIDRGGAENAKYLYLRLDEEEKNKEKSIVGAMHSRALSARNRIILYHRMENIVSLMKMVEPKQFWNGFLKVAEELKLGITENKKPSYQPNVHHKNLNHGKITPEEIKQKLAGQLPGTGLLRESITEEGKMSLSFVEENGEIGHYRINKENETVSNAMKKWKVNHLLNPNSKISSKEKESEPKLTSDFHNHSMDELSYKDINLLINSEINNNNNANQILSKYLQQPGTGLLRVSKDDPNSVVISYVDKEGKIQHRRILKEYNEDIRTVLKEEGIVTHLLHPFSKISSKKVESGVFT